jgi:hypothetical protein
MAFAPAARRNSKLRLALSGTAGTGKTFTALQIAKMFSARVALADSERRASEKYAIKAGTSEGLGNWKFDVDQAFEKTPDGYTKMISEAAAAAFDVLVIDSYSHSWIGARDQVDMIGGRSAFHNGWKVISPKVSKLVDQILNYPGHVIATMRSKAEYVTEKDEKTGKSAPRKIGMETVARDGTDYEFDVMFDLTADGTLTVTKTRCPELPMGKIFERSEIPAVVKVLKAWLDEGVPVPPVEVALERIKFASDDATLALAGAYVNEQKLAGALTAEDLAEIKTAYVAKKAELADNEVPL